MRGSGETIGEVRARRAIRHAVGACMVLTSLALSSGVLLEAQMWVSSPHFAAAEVSAENSEAAVRLADELAIDGHKVCELASRVGNEI